MDRIQLLNDSEAAIRQGLYSLQSQIWTAMPAIVQSVNLTQMTLVAQIAIQQFQINQDGSSIPINISPLVDVPIVYPSAGGFSLTLPITAGDEILVMIASRCIDSWWQSGGFANKPIEARMHDLSDGFAIPGPRSIPRVIGSISSTNAQLRNDAGTVFLELTPGGQVNITAPDSMTFTTEGTVTINGQLFVNGNIATNGEVEAKLGGAGIPLSTHVHGGVTPGAGDTGGPIP